MKKTTPYKVFLELRKNRDYCVYSETELFRFVSMKKNNTIRNVLDVVNILKGKSINWKKIKDKNNILDVYNTLANKLQLSNEDKRTFFDSFKSAYSVEFDGIDFE
jgi:hypothetical protein